METIDQEYIRVTDVLAAFSGVDKIPKQILEVAADRGTRAHKAIDGMLKNLGSWGIEEDIAPYIASYNEWAVKNPEVIATEERFYDNELGITGQIDLICKIDGQTWIIDFKTSSKPYAYWELQLSAYKHLAGYAGMKIDRMAALHLCKHGGPCDLIEYQDRFPLFLNCLEVYKYFFKNGKRLPYEVE